MNEKLELIEAARRMAVALERIGFLSLDYYRERIRLGRMHDERNAIKCESYPEPACWDDTLSGPGTDYIAVPEDEWCELCKRRTAIHKVYRVAVPKLAGKALRLRRAVVEFDCEFRGDNEQPGTDADARLGDQQ